MGVAYSVCAAALWPCIAIVVELHKLGTAYGLMTAFQNRTAPTPCSLPARPLYAHHIPLYTQSSLSWYAILGSASILILTFSHDPSPSRSCRFPHCNITSASQRRSRKHSKRVYEALRPSHVGLCGLWSGQSDPCPLPFLPS